MGSQPKKQLSVFDSTCIIVGIIIGAGIYETAPTVAACMGGWVSVLAIWFAGGVLALTGALTYAELATAYPHAGGDYVYQNRAYGPWAGWLFGWSQLMIIRPGDIALMSFIFSRYATTLYALPFAHGDIAYAAFAVALLTAINILGVRQSKWTQNILTTIKIIGILVIICVGFSSFSGFSAAPVPSDSFLLGNYKLALILVLFTFGGWHEMAYVAAEVKRPERNIVRALVIGTLSVTVLYLLINAAYLSALGPAGFAASKAVAVDILAVQIPGWAERAIAVLVCISALGAINGLIFTGSRISYAMGADHSAFRYVGRWHERLGTPVWALLGQAALALAFIVAAGSFISAILSFAPVVWLFFIATGISVFVLRRKEPDTPRPYRMIAYPLPTIIFVAFSAFMFYNSLTYAWENTRSGMLTTFGVLLVGAAAYLASRQIARSKENHQ